MKNAKQQSGETGEVAPQSAAHQAYSEASAIQDPPPRDSLSYLTLGNIHIRQFRLIWLLQPFSLCGNVPSTGLASHV